MIRKSNSGIVISVVNQKGGVSKTTTSISLAGELASRGFDTLLIDMDPQGDASRGLGFDTERASLDMASKLLLLDELNLQPESVIQSTNIEGLFVIQTGDKNLARTMFMIEADKMRRSDLRLKKSMKEVKRLFDFVIIDCSPTDNILSTNSLVASDYVLIPVNYDKYSLSGLDTLYEKIGFIQEESNENLKILGIFAAMYKPTLIMNSVDEVLRTHHIFGDHVLNSRIRYNIKVSEAPFANLPIRYYAATSNAAQDYASLTDEILVKMNVKAGETNG